MTGPARPNPRAERTRAALIAAGRKLFGARAADAVTVDEIVQAAGVGKGSFYNHFEDREGLMRAIAGEIRSGVEQAVGRANAAVADPAARVARAMCTYLRYALDEPERAAVLARIHSGHTALGAPLNRGVVDDVSQGLATGRFSAPTIEAGVLFVLGVTHASLLRVLDGPDPGGTFALAQQMAALVLRGLGLQPGEAEAAAAAAADSIVRRGWPDPSPP